MATTPNSPEQKLIEALEGAIGALRHYQNALSNLSAIGKDGKTLFEGSPSNSAECYGAWLNLDAAGKKAELRLEMLGRAIPIARSLIAELAELRDKAEALEWITSRLYTDRAGTVWMRPIADANSCPAIIKQMIEQKERTK